MKGVKTSHRSIKKSLATPSWRWPRKKSGSWGSPAMPTGCSMTYMIERFPERVFDVGIAEAHAVTFSAGMAKEGLIPFCNIYSSFMQRAVRSGDT